MYVIYNTYIKLSSIWLWYWSILNHIVKHQCHRASAQVDTTIINKDYLTPFWMSDQIFLFILEGFCYFQILNVRHFWLLKCSYVHTGGLFAQLLWGIPPGSLLTLMLGPNFPFEGLDQYPGSQSTAHRQILWLLFASQRISLMKRLKGAQVP